VLVGTGAAQRWARVVEEFEASGVGAREFAQRRGINPSTLKWWRSQLRRGSPPGTAVPALSFVELQVEVPVTPIRVRLERAAVSFDVPPGTDLRWLRAVVDALC
jgi:transposase-like protein